jgi:hypothetical protein
VEHADGSFEILHWLDHYDPHQAAQALAGAAQQLGEDARSEGAAAAMRAAASGGDADEGSAERDQQESLIRMVLGNVLPKPKSAQAQAKAREEEAVQSAH